MTKHGTALLQQILDEPAADAPRSVYADHLEQEGELDRANFIRYQVKRASLPSWDPQVVTLELAERALLDKHGLKWRAKLPPLDGVVWGGFTRGFVGVISVADVKALPELMAEVSTHSPVNRVETKWPRDGKLPKLAAITTLEELTFSGFMRPEILKPLAACPLLSTLRALTFEESSLSSGLPNLLKSTHLGKLRALRIPLHNLGNAGVAKLAATKALPSLSELDLSVDNEDSYSSGQRYTSPAVTIKSIAELAESQNLTKIQSLDLSSAKLGAAGLLTLLSSVATRALKRLYIRGIKDSDWDMDDSLGAFKAGPAGSLEVLDISDNDLDPDAAHFMAEAKSLRELKVLRMANVKSRSFDRLGKAPWVRSLRVLACNDEPLPHLLPRAEAVHTLEITPSAVPLAKIAQLIGANPPPSLLVLDLSEARVDDAGLKAIAELKLPKLVSVILPRVVGAYSVAALKHLATSKLGEQLTSFECGNPDFDRLPPPPEYIERDEL